MLTTLSTCKIFASVVAFFRLEFSWEVSLTFFGTETPFLLILFLSRLVNGLYQFLKKKAAAAGTLGDIGTYGFREDAI